MTKKRFTLKPYDGIRCDVFDGEIEIAEVHRDDAKGLINLLNELNDENEQLKEERNYFERKKCEYFNKYNKKHLDDIQLKKENEQLKDALNQRTEQCDTYYKENKQLKSELAEIKRQEQEVIEYLQTYHNGDVNELKKELKMND